MTAALLAGVLVGLAARHPWRVGAAGALGVASVDGVYALLAAPGGAAVAAVVAPVAGVLRAAAAAVLLGIAAATAWRAWRTWRAHLDGRPALDAARPASPARTYAQLVALTAVNPATVLFFVVVVAGVRLPDGGTAFRVVVALVFALGAFAASAAWQLVLASAGTALGRVLRGPRGRLGTALVSAALMTALAVAAVVLPA
ncbi:LysE family transporter [Isoptericola variabilis]|uniref:Lysine exporter protein (LYSE/YGGA) n=1 Tax=Isoptericola variabilis (strain 225) TaxID=743718 RepID=F6FU01_ISOV2|nr:LysE family transporter [Isoptericola variabilis]AEG45372.1 Lysine exporter protein (LYSE/YGGA) [Isoptericola variabilis 225]TWH30284.1 arginine exporter protein ArgO [Isoptericola variabilis J7]